MNEKKIKDSLKKAFNDKTLVLAIFECKKDIFKFLLNKCPKDNEKARETLKVFTDGAELAKEKWAELMQTLEYEKGIKQLLDNRTQKLQYEFFYDIYGFTELIYITAYKELTGEESGSIADRIIRLVKNPKTAIKQIKNNVTLSEEEKSIYLFFCSIEEKIHAKALEMQKESKPTQLALPLEYREQLAISLDKISLNNKLYSDKPLQVNDKLPKELLEKKFILDTEQLEESELIIKNELTQKDLEILSVIVLEIYTTQGRKHFSDRQLAIYLAKSSSSETVTQEMLNEINESIAKLQKTDISLGLKSINKKGKTTLKKKNPLIWLKQIEVKDNNTATNYYEIIDTPFYYEYAAKTGIIKEIDRELLYNHGEKANVKNTLTNITFKMYLIRRIEVLENMPTAIINFSDLYSICGATKEAYKNKNNLALAKAQQRVREKALDMLKDFQTEYKETKCITFRINKKTLGRKQTGYILTKIK